MNATRRDQLLTLSDVARFEQVSERTIRRQVKEGLLPVYRLSKGLLRFQAEEVAEALARARVPARSERAQ